MPGAALTKRLCLSSPNLYKALPNDRCSLKLEGITVNDKRHCSLAVRTLYSCSPLHIDFCFLLACFWPITSQIFEWLNNWRSTALTLCQELKLKTICGDVCARANTLSRCTFSTRHQAPGTHFSRLTSPAHLFAFSSLSRWTFIVFHYTVEEQERSVFYLLDPGPACPCILSNASLRPEWTLAHSRWINLALLRPLPAYWSQIAVLHTHTHTHVFTHQPAQKRTRVYKGEEMHMHVHRAGTGNTWPEWC